MLIVVKFTQTALVLKCAHYLDCSGFVCDNVYNKRWPIELFCSSMGGVVKGEVTLELVCIDLQHVLLLAYQLVSQHQSNISI